MKKALYLIDAIHLDDVYGPEEQADLAVRVKMVAPPLHAGTYYLPEWTGTCAETELIFSGWGMPSADASFLQRFPRLEVIFYGAGSVKNFVTPEMWKRGIRIANAYAANAVPVCEYAISQIFFGLKQGWQQARFVRSQKRYPERETLRPAGGYRSTVGLISLGMIGRMVAKHLRAFDVRLIAADPFVTAEQGREIGVEMVSLEELFVRSDVVSCHAPWLKETEKMIEEHHFASMKPGATFLNTARGAVIDEEGMISVLRQRPDLMAVLDVTWPEPPRPESPLYFLENVIITPHIAGSMATESRRMGRTMIEELDRFLANEPLLYEINEVDMAALA